jgi:hypothetical protein
VPERAGDRLTVEVVAKNSNIVRSLFGMIMGDQSVTALDDEIQVKDRTTGDVVDRETIPECPYVADALRKFQDHLVQHDVAGFCAEYGIENYPPE